MLLIYSVSRLCNLRYGPLNDEFYMSDLFDNFPFSIQIFQIHQNFNMYLKLLKVINFREA